MGSGLPVVRGADRLVFLRNLYRKDIPVPMSYPRFVAWKGQTNIFEQVAAFYPEINSLLGMGEPEEVQGERPLVLDHEGGQRGPHDEGKDGGDLGHGNSSR